MAAPALTRHVEDAFPELRDLFTAGEDVEALRHQPGWGRLIAVIGLEVDSINSHLDAGRPLTRAEYAMAHGRRGGLLALTEAADAIVERAQKRHAEQQAKHESSAESGQEG